MLISEFGLEVFKRLMTIRRSRQLNSQDFWPYVLHVRGFNVKTWA